MRKPVGSATLGITGAVATGLVAMATPAVADIDAAVLRKGDMVQELVALDDEDDGDTVGGGTGGSTGGRAVVGRDDTVGGDDDPFVRSGGDPGSGEDTSSRGGDTSIGNTTIGTGSSRSRAADSTRSRYSPMSRDRDRSRGDKTRDWTRDGQGDRTRDWSRQLTNDRSRNDTRRAGRA